MNSQGPVVIFHHALVLDCLYMQFMLLHMEEDLGVLQHLRQHFVTIGDAFPEKTVKKSAKKEKEHCGRQVPTDKNGKNTN